MSASTATGEFNYRAVFISDVHLGMRSSQTAALLDFLKDVECEVLYLVGDIVDFWKVRRGPHWPQSHNDVLQKLLRKARKGTRIIFIPGNHDDGLREYTGMHFGGVELHRDAIHESADGKKYLVLHGDEFDVVVRYARWLAFLGDRSYDAALALNVPLNFARRIFGLGHWSLSAFLKRKVKTAVSYIGEFEEALASEARRRGASGLICGHIHHANDRMIAGIHYLNCGDWVESCTAIAERFDGTFEIIDWKSVMQKRAQRGTRRGGLVEAA
ncbi:UDP-2,3-diacylglucosamine hydrolase [Hyphomicrobium methylovorum]|uniref:metallophosphoesterase n=1 Tax=Hyphomicrobium methylovorum TaxID=84 RepID=UPI0015E6AEFC|nr:UDP-2,3-diacylglucosamine hydrolase [Hyphomicrobium methylovorum]